MIGEIGSGSESSFSVALLSSRLGQTAFYLFVRVAGNVYSDYRRIFIHKCIFLLTRLHSRRRLLELVVVIVSYSAFPHTRPPSLSVALVSGKASEALLRLVGFV